jgi:hypothetical protein
MFPDLFLSFRIFDYWLLPKKSCLGTFVQVLQQWLHHRHGKNQLIEDLGRPDTGGLPSQCSLQILGEPFMKTPSDQPRPKW